MALVGTAFRWLPKLADFISWFAFSQETLVTEPSVVSSYHIQSFTLMNPSLSPSIFKGSLQVSDCSMSHPAMPRHGQRASTTSPGRGYQGPSKEHPAQGDAIRGWVGSPVTQTWEWDGNSLHRAKEQRGDEFAWWVKDQMHPWEDRNHAELVKKAEVWCWIKTCFFDAFRDLFHFLKAMVFLYQG